MENVKTMIKCQEQHQECAADQSLAPERLPTHGGLFRPSEPVGIGPWPSEPTPLCRTGADVLRKQRICQEFGGHSWQYAPDGKTQCTIFLKIYLLGKTQYTIPALHLSHDLEGKEKGKL